jgi:hypothetical protein
LREKRPKPSSKNPPETSLTHAPYTNNKFPVRHRRPRKETEAKDRYSFAWSPHGLAARIIVIINTEIDVGGREEKKGDDN